MYAGSHTSGGSVRCNHVRLEPIGSGQPALQADGLPAERQWPGPVGRDLGWCLAPARRSACPRGTNRSRLRRMAPGTAGRKHRKATPPTTPWVVLAHLHFASACRRSVSVYRGPVLGRRRCVTCHGTFHVAHVRVELSLLGCVPTHRDLRLRDPLCPPAACPVVAARAVGSVSMASAAGSAHRSASAAPSVWAT